MPRRFFKPLSRQRHRWKQRWFMRPFRLLLEHPVFWTLNRRNVTRAFAVGLFVGFIPLPIHLVLGAACALLLRLNLPAAVAGTLISNPLTAAPMYLAAYALGCWLLGVPPRPIAFEMTWSWFMTAVAPIWKPLLLGCLMLGALTAVAGYALLGGLWHLSLVLKYRKRKGVGSVKASADADK
ncbi:MAG TPA: DUF2062 domain-containing protein [Steroidobacter sp.]|jgi:hypothetical protein|nr:DUF2062 domain-containing protein [Steroidobacter sp.]